MVHWPIYSSESDLEILLFLEVQTDQELNMQDNRVYPCCFGGDAATQ